MTTSMTRVRAAAISLVLAVFIVLSLLLISLATVPAHAQEDTADGFSREELQMLALSPQARAIANKLQCPVCDGQAITESNATIARQMRARVQQLVDDGTGEDEILDFFVERYGVSVLREPRPEGIGWGVWLAPPIIAVIGLMIVYFGLRSGRGNRPPTQPTRAAPPSLADDDEIVAQELGRMTRKSN